MAGINDRVQGFLDSWPTIRERLEETDDEGLFHSDGACGSLPGEPEDDLPEALGQRNSGL